MNLSKKWLIPILFLVIIIPTGIFLTILHTVNAVEVILKDAGYHSYFLSSQRDFKIDFLILNNGLFPMTLKRPRITCYLCGVEIGSESFDGIIQINSQSFTNKSVEVKCDIRETFGVCPQEYEEYMNEELVIVLEADCSIYFYQSQIKITFGIKMGDIEEYY
jgi:hypothetical protein